MGMREEGNKSALVNMAVSGYLKINTYKEKYSLRLVPGQLRNSPPRKKPWLPVLFTGRTEIDLGQRKQHIVSEARSEAELYKAENDRIFQP